ncbi:MAG: hypothetical protein PHD21_06160 [Flavobacteriales bacterium]|nr:hypothetical protein [Flavobacteriales bacterium]
MEEMQEVISKLEKTPIEIIKCPITGLPYIIHQGKKLFFPMTMPKRKILSSYKALVAEQDIHSPHRYTTDTFQVKEGSILIDVGAAEGIFALENVEKCSHIILFEYVDKWIDALNATFAPWKNKISIIEKYVSNTYGTDQIQLDNIISWSKNTPIFVKMDIEGAEEKALLGASEFLESSDDIRLSVCCYHRHNDQKILTEILERNGYNTCPSKGLMLVGCDFGNAKPPYLRKGIIYAHKNAF